MGTRSALLVQPWAQQMLGARKAVQVLPNMLLEVLDGSVAGGVAGAGAAGERREGLQRTPQKHIDALYLGIAGPVPFVSIESSSRWGQQSADGSE